MKGGIDERVDKNIIRLYFAEIRVFAYREKKEMLIVAHDRAQGQNGEMSAGVYIMRTWNANRFFSEV